MRVVAQPLIAVADVEAAGRWYCHLLGGASGHGGKEYERVVVGDDVVLQLHDWNVHEHAYLGAEELWLRDPDGYVVVLASRPSDLGTADG